VTWIDTNALPDHGEHWTPPVLSGTDIASTVATLAQFLEKPVNDASLELAAVERADRRLQAFAAVRGARHEAK
jgi:hypothetical protein